jgi:dolichol kinase
MAATSVWRNLFHFSGIVIPLTYLLSGQRPALVLCVSLLAVSGLLETLRITGRIRLPAFQKYLRDRETRRPSGSFFFLLSSLVTMLLFPEMAAVPAVFVLSISDPLASFVGRTYGRRPLLGKSLEGCGTFFLSAFLILMAFSIPIHIAAGAALLTTLTEVFSSRLFDDNLFIPIVAAAGISLLWR